jgi:Phytanoyl-CoA dioxygenase (PhyH)
MTTPLRESQDVLDDTDELRGRFIEEGYLFLRGVIAPTLVVCARSEPLGVLQACGVVTDTGLPVARRASPWIRWLVPRTEHEARTMVALQRALGVHTLTHDPHVESLVARLLDEPIFLHPRTIVRVVVPERVQVGSHVEPHQDFRYLQGSPDFVICWVPLGAYREQHGGLRVLSASHHEGLRPVQTRGDQLAVPVLASDPRWRAAAYRPGDVLMMHGLTIHGALANRGTRPRLTLDFRFQAVRDPIAREALRAPYPCAPGIDVDDPSAWSFDPWLRIPSSLELCERVPPLEVNHVPRSRFARAKNPPTQGKRVAHEKPSSPSRCAVLVPIGAGIERDCELALQALKERGYRVMRLYGHSAIDQARSVLATNALDEGYDELMWIDADVGFDPDDVERLRAHELPISCGIYPKKGPRELAFSPLPTTKRLPFGANGGLHEVLYVGTGFLHTRREVYEDVQRVCALPDCNQRFDQHVIPYFLPMLVPDGDGSWYLGEDFAFCERARRAGYRIIADTTIRLRHIGRYAYTWDDAAGPQRSRKPSVTCRIVQPQRLTADITYPLGGSVERVLFEALELAAAEGSSPVSDLLERAAKSRVGLAELRSARKDVIAAGDDDPPGTLGVAKVRLTPRASITVEQLQAYLFGRGVELDRDEAMAQAAFFRLASRVADDPRFSDHVAALTPLLAYGRLMQRAARDDARASLDVHE